VLNDIKLFINKKIFGKVDAVAEDIEPAVINSRITFD
jgi:hypothetical protein